MTPEVIGLIVVPVMLALLGAIYGGIRGAIRFAQYLTRSEADQADIAKSNKEISEKLTTYMSKNDERFEHLDRRVTVVETVVGVQKP